MRDKLLRLLMAALMATLALGSTGCIQEMSLEPETAAVKVTYVIPVDQSPIGIRTSIAGTGATPAQNDWAFADENGDTTVLTHRLGPTFIVARSDRHDPAYAPVDVAEWGKTYTVTSMVGSGGTTSVNPPAPTLKTTGEILLVFFEQDWSYGPVTSVQVLGEDSHFQPLTGLRPMYDDGTNGDFVAEDGVWSLRTTVATTSYGYGFVVNGHSDRVLRDPHEEVHRPFVDWDGFVVERSVTKVRR